jgi:hypothetical protein
MRWMTFALASRPLWAGLLLGIVVPAVQADTNRVKTFLGQAELFEQQLEWDKACEVYEDLLRTERTSELRQRHLHAMRRGWQVRRHRDPSFRKEVLGLEYPQAVRLFSVVQDSLLGQSVDRKTTEPAHLLQKGVEELSHALADPRFVQQYVPSHRAAEVRSFREFLQKTWAA